MNPLNPSIDRTPQILQASSAQNPVAPMQNMGLIIRLIISLFFCVSFFGCASMGSYNAATGHNEFILVSTPEEVAMGQSIQADLAKQYKILDENDSRVRNLERIGKRLSLISDRQDLAYHFYVINKDDLNAFTIPGGSIYFFTGLLDKLKTDDQIAGVLAHEIGHCAAKHTIKKFQAAMSYDFISRLIFSRFDDGLTKSVASLGTSTVMSLIFSSYSRHDELEADRLAVKYTYLAGFDVEGVIQSFEILEKESKGPQVPVILSSHPYLTDRIEAAKKEILLVKEKYGGGL